MRADDFRELAARQTAAEAGIERGNIGGDQRRCIASLQRWQRRRQRAVELSGAKRSFQSQRALYSPYVRLNAKI